MNKQVPQLSSTFFFSIWPFFYYKFVLLRLAQPCGVKTQITSCFAGNQTVQSHLLLCKFCMEIFIFQIVFRCVLESLHKALSVRRSDAPSRIFSKHLKYALDERNRPRTQCKPTRGSPGDLRSIPSQKSSVPSPKKNPIEASFAQTTMAYQSRCQKLR